MNFCYLDPSDLEKAVRLRILSLTDTLTEPALIIGIAVVGRGLIERFSFLLIKYNSVKGAFVMKKLANISGNNIRICIQLIKHKKCEGLLFFKDLIKVFSEQTTQVLLLPLKAKQKSGLVFFQLMMGYPPGQEDKESTQKENTNL